jgi:conjugative transposon TraJ protein
MAMIDGIMKPTVTGTADMVKNSDQAVKVLLQQKEEAIKSTETWQMYVGDNNEGDRDRWYKYTHNNDDPKNEKWSEYLTNSMRFEMSKLSYNFRNTVKEVISEVLKILFQAASLCINTLRTFQMIVLSIIGPLVFAIAVFDGFQHTLSAWLAKFLNVYMWLPVANIFGAIIGKIQEEMLKLDLEQVKQQGDTYFSATDTGYLIFMLIGIVGYFTVPSVANFIINAGGGSAMLQKITSMVSSAPGQVMSAAGKAGGFAKSSMGNYANMGKHLQEGLSGQESGSGLSGMIGRAAGKAYMAKKLAGDDPTSDRGQK